MMQRLVNAVYPPQCLTCDEMVEEAVGLCAECWAEVHFIDGVACYKCGLPLIGDNIEGAMICEECNVIARPWANGATTFLYRGLGRSLVLNLKHNDRTDLAPRMARWVAKSARPLITRNTIVLPVPLHWSRILSRKYNQAALLSAGVAKCLDLPHQPRALLRTKKTKPLKQMDRTQRFEMLSSAITVHRKFGKALKNQDVLLVDDVMTSGATLAACTEACYAAGAQKVCVVTLARVAKDA